MSSHTLRPPSTSQVLSTAFLLIFVAFSTAQSFAAPLLGDLGLICLCVLYVFFSLGGLVAPYGNDSDINLFYCILFIRDGPLTCNAPVLECALYVGSLGGWVM